MSIATKPWVNKTNITKWEKLIGTNPRGKKRKTKKSGTLYEELRQSSCLEKVVLFR
jgi:hypothetical protein